MFHYSVTTNKSVEQFILDLEVELKEVRFGILWRLELHKKLEEKGFHSEKEHTVLEICNPKEASEVLAVDPMVSYFLPCKVVITHDEEHTQVGLVRPTTLISMMEDSLLTEKAKEIEETLISAIDKAAN